ncbi:LacI family DNA-binding transcriptional regulator [Cohnella sp. REN36]|uniref:LacI family DNA-binding transcriptional regulator n=1 Tax=Cohnella sp. REN36 TaxID=2887347 RepID=UPI001D140A6A|nr:LacI family DNA-binding transcriptional regulator [Cohnella sp. REN36]MCC3375847.1 LacI family transcriptional regulator [Cohnella sp. REN36]
MASTINDVGRLAGVSRQTVSRALNDPDSLHPTTLKKVMRAIRMLDYHPNITARNLANRSVRSIGLFMPFTVEQMRHNLFFPVISTSICQHCAENDFMFQLFTAAPEEEGFSGLFKKLYYQKKVGGLILALPSIKTRDIVELIGSRIPFVLIGRPAFDLELVHYVDVDNVQASYMATRHLLDLGHRSVALLSASPSLTLSEDLLAGFRKAYEDKGIPTGKAYVAHTDLTFGSARWEMEKLLDLTDPPTAVVSADDLLALGAVRAAEERGMSVPGNLSIVCATHNGWGDIAHPKFTYIATGYEQLGHLASNHMISSILKQDMPALRQILPVRLVECSSTAKCN